MLCISVKTKVSDVFFNQCKMLWGCQETIHDDIIPWSLIFFGSENIRNQLRSKMTSVQGGITFYMDCGCLISKGQLMMKIFNDGVHVTQSKQFQGSACYGNLCLGL